MGQVGIDLYLRLILLIYAIKGGANDFTAKDGKDAKEQELIFGTWYLAFV